MTAAAAAGARGTVETRDPNVQPVAAATGPPTPRRPRHGTRAPGATREQSRNRPGPVLPSPRDPDALPDDLPDARPRGAPPPHPSPRRWALAPPPQERPDRPRALGATREG